MAPRHSCHQIRFMLMCPCIINDLFENDGRCYRKLSCWTEQELTVRVQKSTYQPDSTALNLFFITHGFFIKRSLKDRQTSVYNTFHRTEFLNVFLFGPTLNLRPPSVITLTFALLEFVYRKHVFFCVLKTEPAPPVVPTFGSKPLFLGFWLRHMACWTLICFHSTPCEDSKWNNCTNCYELHSPVQF